MSDFRPHDSQWRQLQKYRMRRYQGPKAVLPTNLVIEGSAYVGVKPPGADSSFILHSPEEILKSPKLGCRYIWRLRNDDETIGLVESGEIRPVRLEEIERTKKSAKVIGFAGPKGIEYAGWKRMALFEVPPALAYEWFEQPADYAMSKTLNMSDQFDEDVRKFTGGKMEGRIEVTKAGRDK